MHFRSRQTASLYGLGFNIVPRTSSLEKYFGHLSPVLPVAIGRRLDVRAKRWRAVISTGFVLSNSGRRGDGRRHFPRIVTDDGRADLKAVVQHMVKPLEVAPKGRTIIAGGFLLTVLDSVSAPTSCRHPTWTYTGLFCRICDTVQFRLPLAFLTLKQLKSSHKSTSSA
ncbi:hypothetical protein GGD56_007123 [Rhizobium mongolense]|uniref:Uncharacterized protein n=1 Tax=Rhizobium mongolense TaxID=57676 RepID=A0ABR6IZ79_9HYPH|nr:hypothetical protein [Rhizobium mongolense]